MNDNELEIEIEPVSDKAVIEFLAEEADSSAIRLYELLEGLREVKNTRPRYQLKALNAFLQKHQI